MAGAANELTSYCWNGTIGGYNNINRTPLSPDGKTYKQSDFGGSDWQMWEINELDALNFNDAANVPPPNNPGNGISIRHAGIAAWWNISNPNANSTIKNLPGGAVIGTFSGSAHNVKWTKSLQLINAPYPNEMLNGPIYR
ncbi:MAG: hypothetical protein U1G07_00785 [Verrucomicrobiota bacterium]